VRGGDRVRDREHRDGTRGARAFASARREPTPDDVTNLLAERMPAAGFSQDQVRRAQALWVDFAGRRAGGDVRKDARALKPAVCAAAIEYAIAMVHGVRGVTQARLAARYGVAPAAISGCYAEIRSALELVPGDPRYACR
jgi:hypothetical protein